MIIERAGEKFYAPDTSSILQSDGSWTIPAADLIPLAEHEAQQAKMMLRDELTQLEDQATDAEMIAYARSTWDVCQRIEQIKAELGIV